MNTKRVLFPTRLLACVLAVSFLPCARGEPEAGLSKHIDELLAKHWQARKVQPANLCDDATFLRRVTLDLAGRIPTPKELAAFLADQANDKRERTIQRLLDGPEFPLHFGNVLDQMIQGRFAGDAGFVAYLRQSLREGKSWNTLFREIMLGPWDKKELKAANRFLDKRARTLDTLTADATRVFFGVDISCAKCHDHPLVPDWTQDHFYGMASFFNRTTGGRGKIGEKSQGEVKFLAASGKEKTARMMFLSGQVIDEPVKKVSEKGKKFHFSRREQLVRVALEEGTFFSRAMVNRLWAYFLGRGLVHPVDQMHSGNRPAVPELLDCLAEDFASHDYNLKRLIGGIVSSRAYQLSSRWGRGEVIPSASRFAVAALRPLSRKQLSFSFLLATGNAQWNDREAERIEQYQAIEEQAGKWLKALDQRTSRFQSSTTEALFLSNNKVAQQLVAASDNNLAARLAGMTSTKELVTVALRTVLSRPPEEEELKQLVEWFDRQEQDHTKTCEQLVWALITSAEFRFNH
jgi:hypothetical protein